MQANARALWHAVFGDAETWFDPHSADTITRPTEHAALRSVFHKARGAAALYSAWLDARDAALYAGELDTLADNLPYAAAMTEAEERRKAMLAERKRIRATQMPLFAAAVA